VLYQHESSGLLLFVTISESPTESVKGSSGANAGP
jgi:hypothetical protein